MAYPKLPAESNKRLKVDNKVIWLPRQLNLNQDPVKDKTCNEHNIEVIIRNSIHNVPPITK